MVSIEKLPKSQVELRVEIPAAEFRVLWEGAIKEAGEELEIKGFRKGMAPLEVVERSLGNEKLLRVVAEYAVKKTYPKVIGDARIEAIGAPNIEVTALVRPAPSLASDGVGMAYRIEIAVLPEISLPDYAKIVRETPREEISIRETEVDAALEWLRKSRSVPELSDEFVQSLGNFENLAALRESIRTGLAREKEEKARARWRIHVLDRILEAAPFEVPDLLVEGEEEKATGGRPEAEKRAKYSLLLRALAAAEKVEASREEIEGRANEYLRRFQSPGEVERAVDPGRLFAYTKGTIENEKVFERLEGYARQ